MYVKLDNSHQPESFPYALSKLRSDNPDTSFPAEISNDLLAEYRVYPVTPAGFPAFDRNTHRLIQGVSLVDSVWTQTWTLEQLPEREAAINVRADRDRLLSRSDWTQLSDAPGDTAAWATYREQLRNIPAQEGFPFTVSWPTEPGSENEAS
jgi:hypothetical protein